MDIIDKLKKEKKGKSIFDTFIKKKKASEKEREEVRKKPSDIEVTEVTQERQPTTAPVEDETKTRSVTEFRTEGMHELDMESLGESGKANIKMEYKSQVNRLIDRGKIDEAIRLLSELKEKLAKKEEQQ